MNLLACLGVTSRAEVTPLRGSPDAVRTGPQARGQRASGPAKPYRRSHEREHGQLHRVNSAEGYHGKGGPPARRSIETLPFSLLLRRYRERISQALELARLMAAGVRIRPAPPGGPSVTSEIALSGHVQSLFAPAT